MPISLQPKENNKEKIAFDLMQVIAEHEVNKLSERTENARAYYLELYAQCLSIVSGDEFDDVFDE